MSFAVGTSEIAVFQIPSTDIWLMDSPGFDDTVVSDTDILQQFADELASCFDNEVKISGVLYMHAINEVRMKGSMLKNLRMFKKMVGEKNMGCCVLVTTKWGLQGIEVSTAREEELKKGSWSPLLANGAGISRFEDSKKSAVDIVMRVAETGGFIPKIAQEYVVEGKQLSETEAGREVIDDIEKAKAFHQEEMKMMQEEHLSAIEANKNEFASLLKQYEQESVAKLEEMERSKAELERTYEENIHKVRTSRVLRAIRNALGAIITLASGGTLGPWVVGLRAATDAACGIVGIP
ncbi:MAG: hypothetical protein M1840_005166 [Geoglossum simile]|nr:MAG: hypothetical protein M1840_005166 [Geoglossum simile]